MRSRVDSLSRFARRVLSLVGRIPAGKVVTYGDLARIAGRPRAARAVGTIMRRARVPGLPYHRVIAAGGRVGGYGGAPGMKASLLSAEGLAVRRLRVLEFDRHRWSGRSGGGARPRTRSKPTT